MYDIINELNQSNSTKYKETILKKYSSNKLFKKLLKLTYDKVTYNFWVRPQTLKIPEVYIGIITLEEALIALEKTIANRIVTGDNAREFVNTLLKDLKKEDSEILLKVTDRDLKIGLGKTSINKVFKNLIPKPAYCRCDVFNKDKNFYTEGSEAIVQLKADGTYRELHLQNNEITVTNRSGNTQVYPNLEVFKKLNLNGYFMGEMTVFLDDLLLHKIKDKIIKSDIKNGTNQYQEILQEYNKCKEQNKEYILPRSLGNGLINSKDVPYNNIIFDMWDYITEEDYVLAKLKDKKNPPKIKYKERFNKLKEIQKELNNDKIRIIDYKVVNSLKEAVEYSIEQMNKGLEGAIFKSWDMLFKDGTSKEQLKIKISFNIDVRVVGFKEGTPRTKREKTFGALLFETDDKKIKGAVSGLTDEQLEDFNSRRNKILGKIIEIQGNDLTLARGSNVYAVSHPRFIELREDKDYTDDLNRCLELLELAKDFK